MRPALGLLGLLAWCQASAEALPDWFTRLKGLPGLEAGFVQQGESAIFKAVEKRGRLMVAKGGRIRVAYDAGSLMVADGKTLIQYDPQARTAQRLDLGGALKEAPMLAVLVNPAALESTYRIESRDGMVVLTPHKPGPPQVTLVGRGTMLERVSWTDRTGAKQTLTLMKPQVKASFAPSTFQFQEPKGTRWVK